MNYLKYANLCAGKQPPPSVRSPKRRCSSPVAVVIKSVPGTERVWRRLQTWCVQHSRSQRSPRLRAGKRCISNLLSGRRASPRNKVRMNLLIAEST